MANEETILPVVKLNLRAKLALCMAESERVEMRGENKFHHYKYAKAGDVFAEARVPLAKYGIIVIPQEEEIVDLAPRQTKGEGFMYCVRVKMRYVVMDSDSDEKIEIVSTGEGQDGGDKGIAKAKTFAAKYALQQLLLLPTGDDPEADDAGDAATQPIACSACGVVGSIRKGLPQYGGGWYCNRKTGGCGVNFTEKPYARTEPQPPASESGFVGGAQRAGLGDTKPEQPRPAPQSEKVEDDADIPWDEPPDASFQASSDAPITEEHAVEIINWCLANKADYLAVFGESFKTAAPDELTEAQFDIWKNVRTVVWLAYKAKHGTTAGSKDLEAAHQIVNRTSDAIRKQGDNKNGISEGKQKRFWAICGANKEIHDQVLSQFGYSHSHEIPWRGDIYDKICAAAEKAAGQ